MAAMMVDMRVAWMVDYLGLSVDSRVVQMVVELG